MTGLAAGPVRAPLLQITEAERQELRADLERTGVLVAQKQERPPVAQAPRLQSTYDVLLRLPGLRSVHFPPKRYTDTLYRNDAVVSEC
jgi:hypothetical protein